MGRTAVSLDSRQALFRHIRGFCHGPEARALFWAVERNMLAYNASMANRPIPRFIGSYIQQGPAQRRRIDIRFPPVRVGRPSKSEERVLVSFLAAAFTKATGRPVTLNREGDVSGCSSFEAFLTPILQKLRIADVRAKVSDHMRRRRKG